MTKPKEGKELRAHERYPVDWRVSLRCPDWHYASKVAAQNASRGGLFVLTSRPPAVGSEVDLATHTVRVAVKKGVDARAIAAPAIDELGYHVR